LLGFNGQPHEHNGIYILGNGYRTYSTKFQRFYSQDSLTSFSSAGSNYYAYSLNDPTNRIDPSGHIAKIIRKTFRTKNTKIADRLTAISEIENKLRPITTETLLNDPMGATSPQRTKVSNLVLRAQKKSKGVYKLGGQTSSEFNKPYNNAKYLTLVWNNPSLYSIALRRITSNQVVRSQRTLTTEAPPEYDVVKDNFVNYPSPPPPSYNEVMEAAKNARI
jgi:RHS repeat-associated protein